MEKGLKISRIHLPPIFSLRQRCYATKVKVCTHGKKKKKLEFCSVSPRGSATESFVQNEAARSQTLLAATNRYNQSSFYAATWKSFVFPPPFLLNSLQVFFFFFYQHTEWLWAA